MLSYLDKKFMEIADNARKAASSIDCSKQEYKYGLELIIEILQQYINFGERKR